MTHTAIRRPVATTMLYLMLIVIGFVSLRSLPIDLLPEVEFTQLTVRVRYSNVGPEEIEQIVTDPIENVLSGLPDLERMTSESEEGSSRVRLEFSRGTDIDEAANEVRAALDRVRDELPPEADPPEILKLDLDRIEVVSIFATSTRSLADLTHILEEDMARRLEQIPGVGSIGLRGGVYREIRVDLDRDRLNAAGLTAIDVQQAIGAENVTLPGGNVKSGFADLYVRGTGEYRSIEEIAQTVVATVGGHPIRVRDVAAVRDGYGDVDFLAEVNGVPSVTLGIQKQSGANTVAVADGIRREVEKINDERDDLHLTIFADQSDFIRDSIAAVRNSAVWGSLLAVLVLYLYLRNRSSTSIIALAIPISVISTFGLLYFGGMTLNQMTFGGLALGVGMIVDNAIVVIESIVRKREESNLSLTESARVGTGDVAGAIVASTLTTCVVFLPVVFTRTTSGALFQVLALVVVFSLVCSLFVALTLVPMLAARFLRAEEKRSGGALQHLEQWYVQRIRQAIRHRGRVFGVTAILLAGALALWPLIPVELAPQTEATEIDVELEMAQGTNIAVVRSYVAELEERVRRILSPEDVALFSTEVRGGDAEIELKLEHGFSGGTALADRIRREVDGTIPGAEVRVDAQLGLWILRRIFSSGGGEDAIEIELRDWDLARADVTAAEIRRRMETVAGIADVRVSRREGRPEESVIFDRDRIAELGLSTREVARALQASVGGVEAARFRDRGDEFPITVRLRPEDRVERRDLHNVPLRTPAGQVVPLSSVVDFERGRGPLAVNRVDGQRVTYVSASLESGVAVGDAVERIQNALADLSLPAGSSLLFTGEHEEQQEAQRDFSIAIVMALILVYMLMAAQFERFVDPLVVMLAVPVALIGVVPTLLLTGTTLNIQSVMGLVMLIGIVVNNAIVLVDAVNLLRREHHMAPADAVMEAGRLRLRPILMTTTTTVLGLLPLALGIGIGADIQAAFARVVIGGLVASTLVTLLLIPVAYITATSWTARLRASLWKVRRDAPDERATA